MDSEVFVAASFVWVGLIVSHHKTSDTLRLALYQLINVNWQNYEQEIMPQSQIIILLHSIILQDYYNMPESLVPDEVSKNPIISMRQPGPSLAYGT
jgi:hypothetical protein